MKIIVLIIAAIAGSSALAFAYKSSQKSGETTAAEPVSAHASMDCCMAGSMSAPATADAENPKAKPYPLDVCIVSDEKLGGMGKPVVFEYKGQEIKLCCKSCRKKFDKDPATYLKKLEPKK